MLQELFNGAAISRLNKYLNDILLEEKKGKWIPKNNLLAFIQPFADGSQTFTLIFEESNGSPHPTSSVEVQSQHSKALAEILENIMELHFNRV